MVGRAQPLGAADYAVLGLLRERPRHGYEMAEVFEADGELGPVCAMPRNVLYGRLHRLESLGLLSARTEQLAAAPPRRVLQLTDTGARALSAWLDRPVERIRDVRMEFLVKLYLSARTPGHDTARLVDAQIDACRRYLDARRAEQAAAPRGSFAELLGRVRVAAAEATIAWLRDYRAELDAPALAAR
jgi:DNA-binding PadR family transcriptional regulator